ncbi:cysteine-rich repeat secretory protein 12 [Dorcoceras hygrometricum]|uniref:Cysteine-rich repeat secretory protein 12 n=1 Tax=Dorcoceras hygrometricum TaxID=472368 RepID=A0A2Z7B4P8_9LAMI|nr:cysteine-rich repeat secretory protein 12 [Dorcoceras hygrometricum]
MDPSMHAKLLPFPNFSSIISSGLTLMIFLLLLSTNHSNSSAPESFVYLGCSQLKYNPNSPYQSSVDSVLASLVNSASFTSYNSLNNSIPGSATNEVVYGLFQCRGDLISPGDCHDCVADAVSRLGTLCVGASGGALQYDGCYVRYDNVSFLGVEDKTVVYSKCGPSTGYGSDFLTRRDGILDYIAGSGNYFGVGGSGNVLGYAQCTQDLSISECQDCVSEAIQRLKSQCRLGAWGDIFLGNCYVRCLERGYTSDNSKRLRPVN